MLELIQQYPRVSTGIGLAIASAVVTGWQKRDVVRGWFKGTAVDSASDPDRRAGFTERLHWLTEFARKDLADQQMIDDLNKVHERFTLIRSTSASETSK